MLVVPDEPLVVVVVAELVELNVGDVCGGLDWLPVAGVDDVELEAELDVVDDEDVCEWEWPPPLDASGSTYC